MAFHNHLSHEMALQHFSDPHLSDNAAVLRGMLPEQLGQSSPDAVGKPPGHHQLGGGGPTWLSNAILRQQSQYTDGNFLHLQTNSDSTSSPAAATTASQWLSRSVSNVAAQNDDVPVSSGSVIAAISADLNGNQEKRNDGNVQNRGDNNGEDMLDCDSGGNWENARYKADILAHPLYEQLLSAHVSCLRIATPVDQLPRIDAQLAQSQSVVTKYSVLANQPLDDKELDQFMVRSVFPFIVFPFLSFDSRNSAALPLLFALDCQNWSFHLPIFVINPIRTLAILYAMAFCFQIKSKIQNQNEFYVRWGFPY